MKKINFAKFSASIIICLLAAAVGLIFTTPAINAWYATLKKPSFNPPNWIFAPVWTVLFLLMGISLYLAWSKSKIAPIFWVQLILNVLWSVIFFGFHRSGIAFFELLALWFAVLYTIINFWRVSKTASYLLIPYIFWISFAGILNLSIWLLNI